MKHFLLIILGIYIGMYVSNKCYKNNNKKFIPKLNLNLINIIYEKYYINYIFNNIIFCISIFLKKHMNKKK